jgi:hypothetical protein
MLSGYWNVLILTEMEEEARPVENLNLSLQREPCLEQLMIAPSSTAGGSFRLSEDTTIPTLLIGKGGVTVGCAAEPVEKGDEPTVTIIISGSPHFARVTLTPDAAHALGTALIEDAKHGRTLEVMNREKKEVEG